MPTVSRSSRLAVAAVLAASLGSARDLRADDKQACLDAYDKAQTLRQEGKLVASKEQLLVCARSVCPRILRQDCTEWLTEVDDALPTVVFEVKDGDGRDVVDAVVSIDDKPFVTRIDGRALPVDPGVHVFRFEMAGTKPIDERIVIHAAAKNRTIAVQFKREDVEPEPDAAPPAAPEQVDAGVQEGTPASAYVFGGIGLVGLGAFAYFGTQFDSKLDDMDACKPNCSQADADDASNTRTMALVSAGVGVVSLGIATALLLSGPEETSAAMETSSVPRVDVLPARGGAVGVAGWRF